MTYKDEVEHTEETVIKILTEDDARIEEGNPNSNTNESEGFFKKAMDKAIEEMDKPK
jgi:hypothetical protein